MSPGSSERCAHVYAELQPGGRKILCEAPRRDHTDTGPHRYVPPQTGDGGGRGTSAVGDEASPGGSGAPAAVALARALLEMYKNDDDDHSPYCANYCTVTSQSGCLCCPRVECNCYTRDVRNERLIELGIDLAQKVLGE